MYPQKETVQYCVEKALEIIRLYEWLLDLYVLDFFVDNHWDKLPTCWRESFVNVDPQKFGDLLSEKRTNIVFPLSLLALIKSVKTFSVPRPRHSLHKIIENRADKCISKSNITSHSIDKCNSNPKLQNLFLKHVKLKKRHEISLMAEIVNEVALKSKCNAVIDFGSGLGHLVRVLAYKYDLYAAGIECQSQLTEEARKLDIELQYTAKKYLSPDTISNLRKPIHYNITLSSQNQLHEIPLPEQMKTYGLIGLHPCGDLGPLLLRHFAKNDKIKYICVVGCCYMKLTVSCKDNGYPMSTFVQGLDCTLSYASREIACHAMEVYSDRLRKGNYEDLKVHAYRAALERVLVEYDPKLKHAPVRSIKHSDTMTFERYCSLALERLNVPLPTCPEVLSRGHSDLRQWKRVVTLYTLRLILAPLVETVVLLDRVLYILEQGLSCEIHPVFDPKLSPRNHIIIARR